MFSQAFNRDIVSAFRDQDPNGVGIFDNYSEAERQQYIKVDKDKLANLYRLHAINLQLVQSIEAGEIEVRPITIEGEIVRDEFTRITTEVLKVG